MPEKRDEDRHDEFCAGMDAKVGPKHCGCMEAKSDSEHEEASSDEKYSRILELLRELKATAETTESKVDELYENVHRECI